MVKIVIASAILYYLDLNFWWWIGLFIASLIDLYEAGINNINDAKTVNKLEEILHLLRMNENNDQHSM